jgi:hypothetical protein
LAADQATDKEPKKAGEKMTQRMEQKGDLKPDDYQCGETKVNTFVDFGSKWL